jgi:hypothetical protein
VTLFEFLSLKNDVNVASKSQSRKNCVQKLVLCWHLEGQWRKYKDPDPDPLARGMDPRIRIHPKMSRIRNTDRNISSNHFCCAAIPISLLLMWPFPLPPPPCMRVQQVILSYCVSVCVGIHEGPFINPTTRSTYKYSFSGTFFSVPVAVSVNPRSESRARIFKLKEPRNRFRQPM